MSNFNFFSRLVAESSKHWTFAKIPDERSPEKNPSVTLTPNDFYFKIELKSMHIPDVRKWLTTYHGVAYSFIKVPHLSGNMLEFNVVTAPSDLQKLDERNADRIITNNIPLLGNVPFRGHQVELKIGLYSVKTSNLAAPVIGLLTDMSKTAGVSFVNSALPYTKFLTQGLSILSGSSSDNILEIGLDTTLSQVATGYYIFARVEKGELDPGTLSISPGDLLLLDQKGKPVNLPYLVYQITASKTREDWYLIPEIKNAYQKLQETIKIKTKGEIEKSFDDFKWTVYLSNDLLEEDGEKIVAFVDNKTEKFRTRRRGPVKENVIPDLKDLQIFKE